MARRNSKAERTSSLHPSLHRDVSRSLEADGLYFKFHNVDDNNYLKFTKSNITGRFLCQNPACGTHGWSSKQIAVVIRLYPGNKYNAKVYHQRCQACESLGRLLLNETYTQRVVYRLKKWSGIRMQPPPYSGKKSNGPHNSRLCEGCKAGYCEESLSGLMDDLTI